MNFTITPYLGGSENLRSKLFGHAIGIVLMAIIFGVLIIAVGTQREEEIESIRGVQSYVNMLSLDFGNPVDRELFRESLDVFYPGQTTRNDSLFHAIDEFRRRQFTDPGLKVGNDLLGLTWPLMLKITGMYIQFLFLYSIVLFVVYVAAQRIAIYRFVKMKQHRESYLVQTLKAILVFRNPTNSTKGLKRFTMVLIPAGKSICIGIGMLLVFSPAYVTIYTLKTSLDTGSLPFMIMLAIFSNGILIHTANKLFTLLVAESRKWYVQTAIVKNLHNSYEWNARDGIPLRSLLRIRNKFRSHVFNHIYVNARFQFIPALKEHASFLITGLVIIEMALNVQGHLCYTLLQQLLYRQYDVACVIIFGIFLAVKMTEIIIDIWNDMEKRKYGF
jgi:hypothetical protein